MDYEQKFKESLSFLKDLKPYMSDYCREKLEGFFPELKESEDEKIRKSLINGFQHYDKECKWGEFTTTEILAWLEKQGEQKPCMIQWKGDNLKEVLDFTGKNKNFDKWFKSFEEYEKYVSEHNNIFKLFNSDGSHFEVPIGAWIIKTPDGYNVASKAIFKLKPADKVESKFKVGDWVVTSYGKVNQVITVDEDGDGFTLDDDTYFSGSWKDMYHLWTIQDANDGDVLVSVNPFIFKGFEDKTHPNNPTAYCGIHTSNNFIIYHGKEAWTNHEVHPATKKEADFLFQKMKEAGYEWDADKKELKKIKQKTAWSEDDSWMLNVCCNAIDSYKEPVDKYLVKNWLKSLKPNNWKPSKEQMQALFEAKLASINNREYFLGLLYEDLEKL